MKIHVLPGDALAESFKDARIEGEIVVCRECLIEGSVAGKTREEFWQTRADFINSAYGEGNNYRQKVVAEFEKLENLTAADEVNLWFEYDLFCQINMWFCLSLLQNSEAGIYRVAPVIRTEKDVWRGFGEFSSKDLQQCLKQKTKLAKEEILLGANLWKAYQNNDSESLIKLGANENKSFPKLKEVCQAQVEKSFRPVNTLKTIISQGETDFAEIFNRFKEREGVYGFGDSQVKKLYNQIAR